MERRLLSWNVNGLRAVIRKGFMDWLRTERPDVLCVQEIKARPEQVPDIETLSDYHIIWNPAERKGYSGVMTLSTVEPDEVLKGMGMEEFDSEGRILATRYGDVMLYNVYFPNGRMNRERLEFKLRFYDAFLDHIEDMRKQYGIVVCGDFNTAHKEIDLAHPKENEKVSGFLPVEREWMDRLVEHGYIDTFREFVTEGGHYSWWDLRTRARERDVGWRLDYFFISRELRERLKDAFIMKDVMGSDHCPVGITFDM